MAMKEIDIREVKENLVHLLADDGRWSPPGAAMRWAP